MSINSDGGQLELLSQETPPAVLIRLSPFWTEEQEGIEQTYLRAGKGWYPEISNIEFMDSLRAWWRLSPTTVRSRNIQYLVAVVGDRTIGLMKIETIIGPRLDGRFAFSGYLIQEGPIWETFVGSTGKRVVYSQGSANPIRYWPVDNQESQLGPSALDELDQQIGDVSEFSFPPPEIPVFQASSVNAEASQVNLSKHALSSEVPDDRGFLARLWSKVLIICRNFQLVRDLTKCLKQIDSLLRNNHEQLRKASVMHNALTGVNWTNKSDCLIIEFGQSSLTEPRKGAKKTTWKSSSSGSSYSGVRIKGVSFGSSSGSTSSGSSISYPPPDLLQQIDSGVVRVTTDRVSFIGTMFTKTISRAQIAGWQTKGSSVLFAPKTGTKVWIISTSKSDEFVVLIAALWIWDEFHRINSQGLEMNPAIKGPELVGNLVNAAIGDSPQIIFDLQQCLEIIRKIVVLKKDIHPLLFKNLTRRNYVFKSGLASENSLNGVCPYCGAPIKFAPTFQCICGQPLGWIEGPFRKYLPTRVVTEVETLLLDNSRKHISE
jgi:hypothetical protein